jgi:hypothetical protein
MAAFAGATGTPLQFGRDRPGKPEANVTTARTAYSMGGRLPESFGAVATSFPR